MLKIHLGGFFVRLRGREMTEIGDHVTVYRDPVTKIVPEGDATLVKKLPSNPHHVSRLEVWLVRMDSGEEEIRYISK